MALYLLAMTNGIPVLLVHGGHAHSYFIPVEPDIIDPCPSNAFDDLAHAINGSSTNFFNKFDSSISMQTVYQNVSFETKASACWDIKDNLSKSKVSNSPLTILL